MPEVSSDHAEFRDAAALQQEGVEKLLSINGKRTVDDFHKELGVTMWEYCGMARTNEGLEKARGIVQNLRAEFWEDVRVPGKAGSFNQSLEKAGRVADFLEFAEMMLIDALDRQESCGGHFNEAFQTEEQEAQRDDENFCHVSAWEFRGDEKEPEFHEEPLSFENVELSQRSYK